MTKPIIKMCEWKSCSAKAVVLEAYKGELYNLCRDHGRLIRKQKKADNNE